MFGWEDFGENEKRSGKYERKGVEEGGREKNVRAGYFIFGPTKTFTLPQLGRK